MAARTVGNRIVRWLPAVVWMGWIFWLSSQQALPPPPGISYTIAAIAGHFALYFVLTALALFAIGATQDLDMRTASVVFAIAFGYAISDEFHQSFVPGRQASIFDLIVDATGIIVALVIWAHTWRKTATS